MAYIHVVNVNPPIDKCVVKQNPSFTRALSFYRDGHFLVARPCFFFERSLLYGQEVNIGTFTFLPQPVE